jgi:hypothetical protein
MNPKPPTPRQVRQNRLTALLLAAVVVGLWIYPGGEPADAHPAHISPAASCFPVTLWDAAPGLRPCNRVSTEEDGSGWLTLGTVRRPSYRCLVPALDDRRGPRLTIRCKRASR